MIEAGGWDTHANQGGAKGTLACSVSPGWMWRSMGIEQRSSISLAKADRRAGQVTEFGRTAAVNGIMRGTDHGTAGCAFSLGGAYAAAS